MKRFVLLGASNARRCLPTIFSAARAAAGTPVKVYGAIGHGRSYGSASSVLGRSLPGILECGLWTALETSALEPLDAVLSDAGNDAAGRDHRPAGSAFRSIFSRRAALGSKGPRQRPELDGALRRVARERELRFVEPRREWYGVDPIHIRFRDARTAWLEILGAPSTAMGCLPTLDALRLRFARPEGQSLFGIEHAHAQPAFRARDGSELKLY